MHLYRTTSSKITINIQRRQCNNLRGSGGLVSWLRENNPDFIESTPAFRGNRLHVVAFSGGVDSSLVADQVYKAFPKSSLAVLAVSPSLPANQRDLAHHVAKHIGIPLHEVTTNEGSNKIYIENEGQACYACKTSLYQSMGWDSVVSWASSKTAEFRRSTDRVEEDIGTKLHLYNGTNADDVKDSTRVGLRAAQEHGVSSPLLANGMSKQDVRMLAKEVGLPNWNIAASPCLRSRLALGVKATPASLYRVERAEMIVKTLLTRHDLFDESSNIRVRHLKNGSAAIELDQSLLNELGAAHADTLSDMTEEIAKLGYSSVSIRAFKSGAVAS